MAGANYRKHSKQENAPTFHAAVCDCRMAICKLFCDNWFLLFSDIQSSCAVSGDGLYEGFDWLSATIAQNKAKQTVKFAGEKATKTVTENKAVTTGWDYALSGIKKLTNWTFSAGVKTQQTSEGA